MNKETNGKSPRDQTVFRRIAGDVPREYYLYAPQNIRPDAPIIVTVHGISMNAAEHLVKMRRLAAQANAVLVAPFFSKQRYPRYQRLQDHKSGVRSDLALIDIVESVSREFGLTNRKLVLIGFSGGAQFAHRFAFYHADRVSHCINCAAGWYSYPDLEEPFPYGLQAQTGPGGLSVHPDWADVAHHVIVGSRDILVEPSLNMTSAVVSRQGVGRLERARRWVTAMRQALREGCDHNVELQEVEGLGHDYTDANDTFNLDQLILKNIPELVASDN